MLPGTEGDPAPLARHLALRAGFGLGAVRVDVLVHDDADVADPFARALVDELRRLAESLNWAALVVAEPRPMSRIDPRSTRFPEAALEIATAAWQAAADRTGSSTDVGRQVDDALDQLAQLRARTSAYRTAVNDCASYEDAAAAAAMLTDLDLAYVAFNARHSPLLGAADDRT